MRKLFILVTILLTLNQSSFALTGYIKKESGIYLNYDDLVELSKTPSPEGKLLEKLNKQLNTVSVEQSVTKGTFLHGRIIGDFFRVAEWNIERGFNVDKIEKVLLNDLPASKNDPKLLEEVKILSKAGIIVLNEVDVGLPRTKYQNISARLAHALKMGYVFGTEFVEVDPYQLGVKKFTDEERVYLEDEALKELDNIDKEKYFGLHGTAILTSYPIVSSRIIRIPNCYDWFKNEAVEKIAPVEAVRRKAAKSVFAEKVLTELRHGSRIALVADIKLPNNQIVTVVACHIENRCLPQGRLEQIKYVLEKIKDIKNPVILAGDFNTTGSDASPTTLKKEVLKKVKDPDFVVRQAIFFISPFGLVPGLLVNGANILRQFKNPTARNIPVLMPNKERKLFDYIAKFKFDDGKAFDVRGVLEKTHRGNSGLLSDANERDIKGFKPTFEMQRTFGFAKYKLDWFFIKPLDLKDSNDKKSSYAYAPHYGRTLHLVNRSFNEKISDHDPITVDIPVSVSSPNSSL